MINREYIMRTALDAIGNQQAYTKVHTDKENLLYLMGFNDGVVEFVSLLLDKIDESQVESEDVE